MGAPRGGEDPCGAGGTCSSSEPRGGEEELASSAVMSSSSEAATVAVPRAESDSTEPTPAALASYSPSYGSDDDAPAAFGPGNMLKGGMGAPALGGSLGGKMPAPTPAPAPASVMPGAPEEGLELRSGKDPVRDGKGPA